MRIRRESALLECVVGIAMPCVVGMREQLLGGGMDSLREIGDVGL
jgi:hypothetical protein